jgi:hypothetical protein
VYGYAITTWEILTYAHVQLLDVSDPARYAETPFQSEGIDTEDVKEYILKGGRPTLPKVFLLCLDRRF